MKTEELNILINNIQNFKYCPICGKKFDNIIQCFNKDHSFAKHFMSFIFENKEYSFLFREGLDFISIRQSIEDNDDTTKINIGFSGFITLCEVKDININSIKELYDLLLKYIRNMVLL